MNNPSDTLRWVGEAHKEHREKIVANLCRRFGEDFVHDIEDAVSDAFLKVVERVSNGSLVRPESPVAFLTAIAKRRYFAIRKRVERCRSLDRVPEKDRPAQGWTAVDHVMDFEFSRRLHEWLGRELPHRVRQVILMRLQGLTYREIAAVMGITFHGARVYYVRGITRLRRTRRQPA